jgi:hypothetical protein
MGAKKIKSKEMTKSINDAINTLKSRQQENEQSYKQLIKKYKQFTKIYQIKTIEDIEIYLDAIDPNNTGVAEIVSDSLFIPKPSVSIGSDSVAISDSTTTVKEDSTEADVTLNKKKNKWKLPRIFKKNLPQESLIDNRTPWQVDTLFGSDNKLILYTPLNLVNYYEGTQMLNGYAKLHRIDVDDSYVLDLELVFNSSAVKSSYGSIDRDAFIKINFLRGPSIYLKTKDGSTNKTEPLTGNTIYNVRFQIPKKDDVKRLSKVHLESCGIMWTSGFENYPIYDTDFFIRQNK